MPTFKVMWSAETKIAQVLGEFEAEPDGYDVISTFEHGEEEDVPNEIWHGTHVIYHHVRDALYHQGHYDMRSVRIFSSDTEVEAPPAGGNWLELAEYDNYAIVMDFTNNRYALPALDEEGAPILTRDLNGRFPKRAVSASDVLNIRRLEATGEFPTALRRMYVPATGTWELIGGDGIGAGVPRIEAWTGTRAMYAEPNQRFNRTPNAEIAPSLPRYIGAALQLGSYVLSWVGNDDLNITFDAHPELDMVLTARNTSNPNGFNFGFIPMIPGYIGDTPMLVSAAGNAGAVAHSICCDGSTNGSNDYWPPTQFIFTDADTTGSGVSIYAHVEVGREIVRFSDEVMDFINIPDGNGDMATGTLVVDQHQWLAPQPLPEGQEDWGSAGRIILGQGRPDGDGSRGTLRFVENEGTYQLVNNTGHSSAQITLTVPQAVTEARCRIGMANNNPVGNTGARQRRLAMQGIGVASNVAGGNSSVGGSLNFWLNTGAEVEGTSNPGIPGRSGGNGGFFRIAWSPEFMTEVQLLNAVNS